MALIRLYCTFTGITFCGRAVSSAKKVRFGSLALNSALNIPSYSFTLARNLSALAAGTVDGLGYGDNTKAALMTRGIAELTRLGEALGGKPETFSGLTGVGDLIVTCTSVHSRNRKAGYLMGKGMTADEAMKEVKMVVEGVYSAKAALGLAKKCNVSVPIVEAVNRVLFENADPKEEVSNLLLREKKQEHTNLEWD